MQQSRMSKTTNITTKTFIAFFANVSNTQTPTTNSTFFQESSLLFVGLFSQLRTHTQCVCTSTAETFFPIRSRSYKSLIHISICNFLFIAKMFLQQSFGSNVSPLWLYMLTTLYQIPWKANSILFKVIQAITVVINLTFNAIFESSHECMIL